MAKDINTKFWERVNKNSGCWLWTGGMGGRGSGYGRFYLGENKNIMAHRYSYELSKGSIPEGLVIDHICRVRNCVNPDHLRAITNEENILCGEGATAKNKRKTKCHRGHDYYPDNIYIQEVKTITGIKVKRSCKTCIKLANRILNRKRYKVHRKPHPLPGIKSLSYLPVSQDTN